MSDLEFAEDVFDRVVERRKEREAHQRRLRAEHQKTLRERAKVEEQARKSPERLAQEAIVSSLDYEIHKNELNIRECRGLPQSRTTIEDAERRLEVLRRRRKEVEIEESTNPYEVGEEDE